MSLLRRSRKFNLLECAASCATDVSAWALVLCALCINCAAEPLPVPPPKQPDFLKSLKLPLGFSISVYVDNITNPRMLAVSPTGDLFVSAMGAGSIIALKKDANGDGRPDARAVYLRGLQTPHGIVFGGDDYFYFAEGGQVSRVPYQAGDLEAGSRVQTVIRGLPTGGNHFTKSIAIGPANGKLYVSIGSTCNVCIEQDERRAAIMQFDRNGDNGKVFSRGIRNGVGLAFQPKTNQLFCTVNGRDLLGDDFPGDTLIKPTDGSFHGWPFANEDTVPDPDFGKGHQKEIDSMVLPALKFQAHSAALGICFYHAPDGAKGAFPSEYENDAFVAFHGSWNRNHKTGYKVVRVRFDKDGNAKSYEDFVSGWLDKSENVLGRPAGVAVGTDGSLFVSDDTMNRIYRVSYSGGSGGGAAAALGGETESGTTARENNTSGPGAQKTQ